MTADSLSAGPGSIAILGGGNLGRALALGWVQAWPGRADSITVTRRKVERVRDLEGSGIHVTDDNAAAVRDADIVVLAVQPQHLAPLSEEIRGALDPKRHAVVSVLTGVELARLEQALGLPPSAVVRAMPNTPAAIGEGMTCLCGEPGPAMEVASQLFDAVGQSLVIPEHMMSAATALSACGVAFFLRCIRAASQGGIEIGFHPEEALLLAAQTARGAAALLLQEGDSHPESEIDRVTTPRGCTIAGLNEMEHQGLSSALIRGIVTSARKAEGLGG